MGKLASETSSTATIPNSVCNEEQEQKQQKEQEIGHVYQP